MTDADPNADEPVQTSLESHAGREVVAYERDPEGGLKSPVRCPDCGQDVTASKGTHPLPDDCAADRAFGWACETCENTMPTDVVHPDAPTFNDRFTGLEVEFRDGTERLIPVPVSDLESATIGREA